MCKRKKISVLVIGLTDGIGGVENYICNLFEYIDKDRYDLEFLVHQNINKMYIERIKRHGGKILRVTGIKKNPVAFLRDIVRLYKRKFDIVHLNECSAAMFVYALPLLYRRSIKLIVHSHNGDWSGLAHKILLPIQNKRTDYRCACSPEAAKWMFGENCKNYSLIHNGIDLEKFKYNETGRRRSRENLNIGDNEVLIGSVARFEEQKNHSRIISIFEKLSNRNNKYRLLLVGSGSRKDSIISDLTKKNLLTRTIMLENRTDVNELMMGMDIFLMPSLYEGLPFVAIECQASGLPLIVSDTVSSDIDITDLVHRKKLDDNDDDWCNEIEIAIEQQIDRKGEDVMSDLIRSGYDIKRSIAEIEKIYMSITEE